MVEDFPCGKVVIDVGRRYITVYRCDGNGFVEDEERFKLPWLIDRKDAADMANAVFDVVYAWADAAVNPPAARGGEKGADSEKRRPAP
jgi:hypothetical protein